MVLINQLIKWTLQNGQFLPGQRFGPAASRPVPIHPVPATVIQPAGTLTTWLRPRLARSFLIGGSVGALLGIVPAALFGLSGWTFAAIPSWVLLWVLGATAAGAWRAWLPSTRLAETVTRYIGWERLLKIAGSAIGGIIGTLLGLIFWWAIFPIFLGLYSGAKIGARAGQKIWLSGRAYGWERIGVVTGALTTASLGGFLAYLVASSALGDYAYQPAVKLVAWLTAQGADQQMIGSVIGAYGGALGGALSGIASDLVARLAGLLD